MGTDTAAIRARHVPSGDSRYQTVPHERSPNWCIRCGGQTWPCDAHVLGVALEACEQDYRVRGRILDQRNDEALAAEAREQRLIETLGRIADWTKGEPTMSGTRYPNMLNRERINIAANEALDALATEEKPNGD